MDNSKNSNVGSTDVFCPKCRHKLGSFEPPSYCDNCGFLIQPPSQQYSDSPKNSSHTFPLNGFEILAIFVFLVAKILGASFLFAIAAVLVVLAIGWVLAVVWRRGVVPTARKVHNDGILGAGKAVHEKIVKPILYGKQNKKN